ncbi:pyridoxamine 5'-phosphate oxidase family protein [Selenomonadales bacterium OttesenSCG-928-I06]|nr:pyridoxamine 5'-phosphate oxidase family protein [Selenomonadales bacterium OttesenSCG-928-I06]
MRRKDREMDKNFAFTIIDKCEYGFLSSINSDSTPYCVPISIVREENTIYFHCAHDGKKTDNMRQNPKVCLSFVGDTNIPPEKFTTEYESAVISGIATEILEDSEKTRALKLLCLKQTPSNMHNFTQAIEQSLKRTAVWIIEITEVTGKRKKYDQNGKEMKFGRME